MRIDCQPLVVSTFSRTVWSASCGAFRVGFFINPKLAKRCAPFQTESFRLRADSTVIMVDSSYTHFSDSLSPNRIRQVVVDGQPLKDIAVLARSSFAVNKDGSVFRLKPAPPKTYD